MLDGSFYDGTNQQDTHLTTKGANQQDTPCNQNTVDIQSHFSDALEFDEEDPVYSFRYEARDRNNGASPAY